MSWSADETSRFVDRGFVSDEDLSVLLAHVSEVVLACDAVAQVTFVSPAVRELAGYEPDWLVGRSVLEFLHPDDAVDALDRIARWQGRRGATVGPVMRVCRADQTWVDVAVEAVTGPEVATLGTVVVTLRSVGPRTDVERQLRQRLVSEDRLTRLATAFVNLAPEEFEVGLTAALAEMGSLEGVDRVSIWRLLADGGTARRTHVWVAPDLEVELGSTELVLTGTTPGEQLLRLEELHIDDVAGLAGGPRAELHQVLSSRGVRSLFAVPMVERGRCAGFVAFDAIRAPQVFESVHVSALRTAAAILAQAFARHEAERELAFRARHDALTGVGSRWLFRDELGRLLDDHRRRGADLAVLLVDLDRLKMVNDSLGHGAGDDLLVSVASRVSTAALPSEIVARLGGDELAVLCPDVGAADEAMRRAGELQELLETPVVVAGHDVVMTASVGVVFVAGTEASIGPDEVLHRADVAMYAAKDRGRNRVELYDAPLRDRAASRLRRERELRQAVDEGRFVVHYQAEFDLATGSVVGAEALVRWDHPERGLVVAGEFVPLAEETGVILDLGSFVLAAACRQLALWQADRTDREMVVRVNLSARQVAQPDLVDQVVAVLAETGIDPATLCLEITETTLMADADLSLEVLTRLKQLGIRLAVDDFGTGFSSLAYLRRFPVDVVKIDRSFVDGLGTDPDDTAIVSAILGLADALGIGTTAEGVETPGQLAELRRLGCGRAQGFLLARPEPPDALAQQW